MDPRKMTLEQLDRELVVWYKKENKELKNLVAKLKEENEELKRQVAKLNEEDDNDYPGLIENVCNLPIKIIDKFYKSL